MREYICSPDPGPESLRRPVYWTLGYEELEYEVYEHRLLAAVERSLECLKIKHCNPNLCGICQSTDLRNLNFLEMSTTCLSRCPELRQLEVDKMFPLEQERILILSITSTNLRKPIFTHSGVLLRWYFLCVPCWKTLDEVMCGLIDRLRISGYKNIWETEFRADLWT